MSDHAASINRGTSMAVLLCSNSEGTFIEGYKFHGFHGFLGLLRKLFQQNLAKILS